jgi:hypothetical protein
VFSPGYPGCAETRGKEVAGIKDVHALYSELCGITHPSAETVAVWYEAEKEAQKVIWRRNALSNRERITEFLDRWKPASEVLVNSAFVPGFMSLTYLHKFDFLLQRFQI